MLIPGYFCRPWLSLLLTTVRPSRRRRTRRRRTTIRESRRLRETLRFNHLPQQQQLPRRQFMPPFLCCCRCFHLHIWFRCCTSRCRLPAASIPVRFGAGTSGKNGDGATTAAAAAAAVQLVDENKSFCVCFLNCFFFLDYLPFLCRRTKQKRTKVCTFILVGFLTSIIESVSFSLFISLFFVFSFSSFVDLRFGLELLPSSSSSLSLSLSRFNR